MYAHVMNVILSIFSASFGALAWSLLIVAALVGLLLLVIKGIDARRRPSAVGIIAMVVMSVLMMVEIVPAIAATGLKSTVNDINSGVNSLTNSALLFGGGNFRGLGLEEKIGEATDEVAATAIKSINDYILKKSLIALAIFIVGAVIVFATLETTPSGSRRGTTRTNNNKSTHRSLSNGKPHFNRSRRHRL